jgi:hypothetical protein
MKKDHLFWMYPVIYFGLLVIAINWTNSDLVISAAEDDDSNIYASETSGVQTRISGNLGSGNQDYNPSEFSLMSGNIPERPSSSQYIVSGRYDSMHIPVKGLLYRWIEFDNDTPDPIRDLVVAMD